ncbi:tripartite ATP-independent transporter DctM subunit [Geomicrobium halophilum]|uniref:Tripartite ATP-independent transporter DctM subunit n=1 Tax=Geomicrobium halophilum TaxID=549000 RepID=A0A841PQY2_9BACL|nr:TRAP transporter large permease [Geomicrobium halophilum]MBB6448701.1 tripartite ATP-independent transporter DctM subunit [Geomicrobium halophilum]
MELLITILILLVSILLNIPVALALIISSAYYVFTSNIPNGIIVQQMVEGSVSFTLLAILFFITTGNLMNYTGITTRILNFAQVITRHTIGRLAKVNVILSTFMGGLSGSNIADAAMNSKILVPRMEEEGYDKGFATALTAATSLITPILPPGIALILYGFVGNVSIGDLFVAGVVPGLLLAFLMLVLSHFISKRRNFEVENKKPMARPKEVIVALRPALLAILLPVIIIGGIRLGVFGPSEAGVIAVLYALFLGLIVYREMKLPKLAHALFESAQTAAIVMLIIAGGSAFGWVLTVEQVPQQLTEVVNSYIDNPFMFFIVALIFLLLAGMFVEGNVLIMILTPLFMPMLNTFGIDPVHFGIFFVLAVSIGTLTPPVGTVLFTTSSITGVYIEKLIKEMLPFYLILIIAALLIAFIPAITLWLPNIL